MIGMLLWIARCARPDLAFAVSRLGTRVARWDQACDDALHRLICYIKRHIYYDITSTYNLKDKLDTLKAEIFTDASLPNGKSQSGYILCLTGTEGTFLPIAWASSKQPITADSTPASEMIAAHLGVRQCLTLAMAIQMDAHCVTSDFLNEVPLEPVKLRVDNMVVVTNSRKGMSDSLGVKAKALNLRVYLLRDLWKMKLLSVEHVGTKDNCADIFTKAFNKDEQARVRDMVRVLHNPETEAREANKLGPPKRITKNKKRSVKRKVAKAKASAALSSSQLQETSLKTGEMLLK